MTEAQHVLLENRLLGNVRVFLEIGFQNVEAGFGRRRDITHCADPFDRTFVAARLPSLLLQDGMGKLGRGFADLVEFLESYFKKYPDVPKETILKQHMLSLGNWFSDAALDASAG